jgi:hypothetical protein
MIEVQENYDEIKDLSLFYQPTLLRNILGIISVSLIMTWVEIAILIYDKYEKREENGTRVYVKI